MKILLFGAGRLAHSLLPALLGAGHDVLGVASKGGESARRLAELCGVPCGVAVEALRAADVCFLCTRDGEIAALAREVRGRMAQEGNAEALLVHTAGAVPLSALGEGPAGVVYPFMTFTQERTVDFHCLTLFVEASSPEVLQKVRALAASLGGQVMEMASPERERLHLAGVFGGNFPNHLFALAADMLVRHGIPAEVLRPMWREMLLKLETTVPREAQTGPAVRGDAATMAHHLELLAEEPALCEIYELLSRSIQKLYT